MPSNERSAGKSKNWFLSPWTTFAGMMLGGCLGVYGRALVPYVSPMGRLYMALLGMCVLPIILTAIISGLGRLLKSGESSRYLRRMVTVFSAGVLVAGSVGVLAGLIGKPGMNLGEKTQLVLGRLFLRAEIYSTDSAETVQIGLYEFLNNVVPNNIFQSLSQGQTLAVVMISILLGCALGLSDKPASNTVLDCLDVFYGAFLKIIGWVLYVLPVGLFCFTADQVNAVGPEIFIALIKFVLIFYLACYFMCFLYSVVIWRSSDLTLTHALLRLKEPLIVAFGTRSSVASIPVAMRCLQKELNLDEEISHLVVPLGVIMNRHSFPLGFSLTAILVSQLYMVDLGLADMVYIIFTAALAGMAAAGPPAVVASMMAFVLNPVGLPLDVGIMLFAAAGPVIEPIITVINIHGSCAAASIIARPLDATQKGWLSTLIGNRFRVSTQRSE